MQPLLALMADQHGNIKWMKPEGAPDVPSGVLALAHRLLGFMLDDTMRAPQEGPKVTPANGAQVNRLLGL